MINKKNIDRPDWTKLIKNKKIDLTKNLLDEDQEINIIYFFNAMLSPLFHKLFKIQLQKLMMSQILNRGTTKLYIVCII